MRAGAISSLNSFRNLAEIPSGPVALCGLTLFNSFRTPASCTSTFSMKLSAGCKLIGGVSFVGVENALQYCWLALLKTNLHFYKVIPKMLILQDLFRLVLFSVIIIIFSSF